MKNIILIILLLPFTLILEANPAFKLVGMPCNLEITGINVSGSVGISNGVLDFSDACITYTGTIGWCDDAGNQMAQLNFTATSEGCEGDNLTGTAGGDEMTLQQLEEVSDMIQDGQASLPIDVASFPIAYPNPSTSDFIIDNLQEGQTYEVYNLSTGVLIKSGAVGLGQNQLTLELETSGIYQLIVNDSTGLNFKQKIVKQ